MAERHLWLNLTEIREKEKEKAFLLNATISCSGLFGNAVKTVIKKFKVRGAREILNYLDEIQGAGDSSQGLSPSPPLRAWPLAEWPEECAHSSPADHFFGVCLDSTSMQARLAPARVESIQSCAARFKLVRHMSVVLCRRLLGLMAAASPVLPLGLLHVRPFLWWMKSLGIRPSWPSLRLLKMSGACFRALLVRRDPSFLLSGVHMGVICRRHMITTDTSLSG